MGFGGLVWRKRVVAGFEGDLMGLENGGGGGRHWREQREKVKKRVNRYWVERERERYR